MQNSVCLLCFFNTATKQSKICYVYTCVCNTAIKQMQHSLCLPSFFARLQSKHWKICYVYFVFCIMAITKLQNSWYLKYRNQANAKYVIVTLFFAKLQTKKYKIVYVYFVFCKIAMNKLRNMLCLLCFLQYGNHETAK